jgi:hypothetical protein
VLDCEWEEIAEMMNTYFPYVDFKIFFDSDYSNDGVYLDLDYEILRHYIEKINNKFYLDIPKMAGNRLFEPFFPKKDIVKTHKNELNRMKDSEERPDITYFFIKKDAEKFANKLNSNLDNESKIDKEYLAGEFSEKYLQNEWCSYVLKEKKRKTKYKNTLHKFAWNFPDINKSGFHFLHRGTIYHFFSYYAHKKCTLYLFGADFIKFMESPERWLNIPDTVRNRINFSDFLWKIDDKWDEAENKKHLLEKLELNADLEIDFKNIYFSFYIPLLSNENYCLRQYNKYDFVRYGYGIIENTVLRTLDTDNDEAVKKKVNYLDASADELIKRYKDVWEEIINYILEGPYLKEKYMDGMTKREKRIKEDIHIPTPFEKFIEQVAIEKNARNIRRFRAKQAAEKNNYIDNNTGEETGARKGVLTHTERVKINDYYKKISNLVSKNDLDEAKSKLQLYLNGLKYKFSPPKRKLFMIYYLIKKEKDKDMAAAIQDIKQNTNGSEVLREFRHRIYTIYELYDMVLNPNQQPETEDDRKLKEEEDRKLKEKLGIIIENIESVKKLFKDQFPVAKEWYQYVNCNYLKEELVKYLLLRMNAYPPHSIGVSEGKDGTNSILFKEYCEKEGIDTQDKKRLATYHDYFANQMRNFADELEKLINEWKER